MAARLSIVIPTLDAGAELPGTLAALMEGVEAALIRDVVISDGGSADATLRVAEAAGAEIVTGPAGRGGQIARGVAAARGDWLMLLHADTHPGPGWAAAVARHMRTRPDRAGWFPLRFRAEGWAPRIVETWANARSRLLGLPFGDQGLLVSREVLAAAGGVPQIPLMEDVALARRLSGRLARLDARALTSWARYRDRGWLRQGAGNLARQVRFLAGAEPGRLARRYDR